MHRELLSLLYPCSLVEMVDFNWSTISELRLSEETTANASRNAMTDIEDNNVCLLGHVTLHHWEYIDCTRSTNRPVVLHLWNPELLAHDCYQLSQSNKSGSSALCSGSIQTIFRSTIIMRISWNRSQRRSKYVCAIYGFTLLIRDMISRRRISKEWPIAAFNPNVKRPGSRRRWILALTLQDLQLF